MFEHESDEAVLRMTKPHHNNERIENIMKFYSHLSVISWIAAPKMHAFYMARFAQFCLTSKVACTYLPSAFVGFGACLCNMLTLSSEILVGYRIGKMGLMLLNRFELDKDKAWQVYLAYYRGLVSSHLAKTIMRCTIIFQLLMLLLCDLLLVCFCRVCCSNQSKPVLICTAVGMNLGCRLATLHLLVFIYV